jgi:cyclopropane-fatty-acyl-phospholipid synthase
MSLLTAAIHVFEDTPAPDVVSKAAIEMLVANTRKRLERGDPSLENAFARDMTAYPIAQHADAANAQHYEVPAEFFSLVLGPRRKYSSCLYDAGATTLAQAEDRALAQTCIHAELADGQSVLELGCGWGSLSLWMAEHYPASQITAVSNSASQRAYIEARATERGLTNLTILTADMNVFSMDKTFDRIVSVEMFEHMANWRALLERVRTWLKPDGRLFIHVFTHRTAPYRFDVNDKADWIAQYFFTGGVMPSHGLMHQFPDLFEVEADWRWSGAHYQKTALDWLANFDRNEAAITPILQEVYGKDARVWKRRWRLFFLATAGLFGHQRGEEWGVSHYRLKRA